MLHLSASWEEEYMQRCNGLGSNNGNLPTPQDLRTLVGGKIDLWYFQSPKNKCRFVLCGELLFLLAVALEADKDILSYAPCDDVQDAEMEGNGPHIRAKNIHGGTVEFRTVRTRGKRGPKAAPTSRSAASGIVVITDEWLYERRVLLDNWIFLLAAINRVRKTPWFHEAEILHDTLSKTHGCTLGHLLALTEIDVANMLGAVADALQRRTVKFDTATYPLTLLSLIEPGESS